MEKILCLYYSRTGHTRELMEKIAEDLSADMAEITDEIPRQGARGYLRCAMDAVRKASYPVNPLETPLPLNKYDMVILGTPVWAGRCASPVRSFLKGYGLHLRDTAFVLCRSSSLRYDEVVAQMNQYISKPCSNAVSIRYNDTGMEFWRNDFVKNVKAYFVEKNA